jgi:hypothetical protein
MRGESDLRVTQERVSRPLRRGRAPGELPGSVASGEGQLGE